MNHKEKYSSKENYITANPSVEWWRWHNNADLIRTTSMITGQRVADFGCNHGACTILMAEYDKVVVGFDQNEKALREAERLLSQSSLLVKNNLTFRKSFFNQIDACDGEFSGGYMIDVFEHIYPEDRKEMFEEIKRVLHDNGYLVIVTPYDNASDCKEHVDHFDVDKLKGVLVDLGMNVKQINRVESKDIRGEKHNRIIAICSFN